MTKQLSIAGLVVAAAASSAIAFGAAPAKAACTDAPSAGQNCSTFNPTSPSNLEGFGFADSNWVQNNQLVGIRFTAEESIHGGLPGSTMTFTPDPMTITDIAYSFDGTTWLTTGINTSVQMPSTFGQSANIVTSPQTFAAANWSTNFRVRFTVPTLTSSNAGQLAVRVSSNGTGGANTQTRLYSSTTLNPPGPATGTPGPLPLLGAGVAFGFSRSVRKRIAASV
jgi:hypothetical protein